MGDVYYIHFEGVTDEVGSSMVFRWKSFVHLGYFLFFFCLDADDGISVGGTKMPVAVAKV